MPNQNPKITALYCRLSQEDERNGTSGSIEHHKQFLEKYAADNGLQNPKLYVDNGFSGVSFDRPGYQEMLAGAEKRQH